MNHPDFGLHPNELRFVVVGGEWARRFAKERERIAAALGAAALAIEHIGSTAIPGISAKPILDISVAIDCFESGHALVPGLVALGYEYRGENGIPRRHFFIRGETPRTHHLHIFEWDSDDWRRHLRFRDRLRALPELAARYSQLKIDSLVLCGGDRECYQELKSAFIAEYQA